MSRLTGALLAAAARSTRGIVTGEPRAARRQTWGEVHAQALRIASALIADGLRPGAAVAVLAAEPALVAPAAQAVWLAGGSVTMLHQPAPGTDLNAWSRETFRVLGMINAGLVLLGSSFEPVAPLLRERGTACRRLAELAGPAGTAPLAEPVPAGEQDIALLQLTSGSTGDPKAVRLTHGNLYANVTAIAGHGRVDPGQDVMMSWLPLFHDLGMVVFLVLPMMLGVELVKVTPADFLATGPLLWPELISRYRATITAAPNFAYAVAGRALSKVDDAGALDLASLRVALSGAEPVDPAAVRQFTDAGSRFGMRAECVLAAYGLAEATVAVSGAMPSTGLSVDVVHAARLESENRAVPAGPGPGPGTRTLVRLGPPLPGVEVTVVSPAGTPLGEREVGELRVRGASVSPGYLTANGPVPVQDDQGWLHTGDLGYLAEGEVVVCGRSKDVIIMGGRNIYPADIEQVVASVSGVRAGSEVAVRLDAGTERERFAIAAESSCAGDEDAERLLRREIIARVTKAIGARPSAVAILAPGSLPTTSSGKVRRTAAGELVAAQAAPEEPGLKEPVPRQPGLRQPGPAR